MKKIRVLLAVSIGLFVFSVIGLVFISALRDIFGKSFEIKPAFMTLLLVWVALFLAHIIDGLVSKKK